MCLQAITKLIVLAFVLGVMCTGAMAFNPPDQPEGEGRRCAECHNCTVPTVQSTCLKATIDPNDPVFRHSRHDLSEAPDSVVIGSLSNLNAPVCFKHKHHANMSEMGSGCTTCHHYSPAGEIPPCSQCHYASDNIAAENGESIPLEEAYHRQCRNCHEDWGDDASCKPCHQAHSNVATGATARMPVSKVYETEGIPDSVVTFQHVEHVELFQFGCPDCHRQEQCHDCHGACKTGSHANIDGDVKVTCLCCHRSVGQTQVDETCTRCHHDEAQPPLFHQIVGKDVPEYFKGVGCESCHLASR